MLLFGVNCRLQLAGLGKTEREEGVKPTFLCRKQRRYYRQTITVETLNLIAHSKSLPAKLNNSTIELHVPSRRKKKTGNHIGSITSRCSGKEPALLPRTHCWTRGP